MSQFLKLILEIISLISIIAFSTLMIFYNDSKIKIGINYKMKREIKKIDNNLTNVFDKIQKENSDFSYRKSNIPVYDYILTTKKYRYYVKIIMNKNNSDIFINSAMVWNFGKTLCDEKGKEVKKNVELIRFDSKKDKRKSPRKLFIIYPSAPSILMIVNECEYEIVNSSTDVYGNNIITFENLKKELSQAIEF